MSFVPTLILLCDIISLWFSRKEGSKMIIAFCKKKILYGHHVHIITWNHMFGSGFRCRSWVLSPTLKEKICHLEERLLLAILHIGMWDAKYCRMNNMIQWLHTPSDGAHLLNRQTPSVKCPCAPSSIVGTCQIPNTPGGEYVTCTYMALSIYKMNLCCSIVQDTAY